MEPAKHRFFGLFSKCFYIYGWVANARCHSHDCLHRNNGYSHCIHIHIHIHLHLHLHLHVHVISYHIISIHIISYHIESYHIISYHITSYHIMSYHIISHRIISNHIISHHIKSYHMHHWLVCVCIYIYIVFHVVMITACATINETTCLIFYIFCLLK